MEMRYADMHQTQSAVTYSVRSWSLRYSTALRCAILSFCALYCGPSWFRSTRTSPLLWTAHNALHAKKRTFRFRILRPLGECVHCRHGTHALFHSARAAGRRRAHLSGPAARSHTQRCRSAPAGARLTSWLTVSEPLSSAEYFVHEYDPNQSAHFLSARSALRVPPAHGAHTVALRRVAA
jgi:hypothetical protein